MNESRFHILMAKNLAGELSPAELEEWNGLLGEEKNREIHGETEEIWQQLELVSEESLDFDPDSSWGNFEQELFEENDEAISSAQTIRPWKTFLKVAAMVVVLFGLSLLLMNDFGNNSTQLATNKTSELISYQSQSRGEEHLLPDGTKVWLNSGTTISYSETEQERLLELRGEAYFDVAHKENQVFRVNTVDARITVLGTAFNVRAYPKDQTVELHLDRGKVRFEAAEKSIEVEDKGDARYTRPNQELKHLTIKSQNLTSWKSNQLKFENSSMQEVVASLERHFNTRIKLENPELLNCRFTGEYQAAGEKQIMKILAFALEVELEKDKDRWLMKGKGCPNN